jgi:hypothetical protein
VLPDLTQHFAFDRYLRLSLIRLPFTHRPRQLRVPRPVLPACRLLSGMPALFPPFEP